MKNKLEEMKQRDIIEGSIWKPKETSMKFLYNVH